MKVINIKNVSDKRVSIIATNGMEVSLPPGQDYDNIDVTNLEELGEKVTYIANLTEVGNSDPNLQKLRD